MWKWDIHNPSTVTYLGLGKMGRLGNQLFEIAATLGIAKSNRCQVVFSKELLDLPISKLFQLDFVYLTKPIIPDKVIAENSTADTVLIPADGFMYSIEGYRQAREYLDPIQDDLRKIFQLKNPFPKVNAIAVHIRRTDCIKEGFFTQVFDRPLNCSLQYYQRSISRLKKLHCLDDDYPVIVVTDDRKWCQDHLADICPNAILSDGGSLEDDFRTLSAAKYLVISNSTFSVWGAFLNSSIQKHPDRIVAPSLWFHPENVVVQVLGSNYQNICLANWLFQDPFCGEVVPSAYQYSVKRTWLRGLFLSNNWR